MTPEHLAEIDKKLMALELQLGRCMSDMESEKGTRRRAQVDLYSQLEAQSITLHDRINVIERVLNGNGSDGVKQKVTQLQTTLASVAGSLLPDILKRMTNLERAVLIGVGAVWALEIVRWFK